MLRTNILSTAFCSCVSGLGTVHLLVLAVFCGALYVELTITFPYDSSLEIYTEYEAGQ